MRSALGMHKGNKLKAAKELGISRCYLHRLLNQLEVGEAEAELQETLGEDSLEGEMSPAASPAGSRTEAPARAYRASMRIA